ncbi:MAG: flavodoxin family protein [Bacilli bacterium]
MTLQSGFWPYGGTRGDGNTECLTERAIQGLTVDRIYLRNYTVSPIEDLRHTRLGFQDIEDDYGAIIDRMMKHGTLLFATPIYWYSMTVTTAYTTNKGKTVQFYEMMKDHPHK